MGVVYESVKIVSRTSASRRINRFHGDFLKYVCDVVGRLWRFP